MIGFKGMSDITEVYGWMLVGIATAAISVLLVKYRRRNG
jgi:hypothetical protein